LRPPTITAPPLSQTVTLGGQLSLSVTATGSEPLAYQWFFSGQPIAGATNATFSHPNLDASQAGAYTVTVSNAAGVTTSPAATIATVDLDTYAIVTLAGPLGAQFRVDWSSTPADTNSWQVWTNVTLSATPTELIDRDSRRTQKRFYRVVPLQK
jgi:hypothetical protein